MVIPSQEENIDTTNTFQKIRFHVYINISCCKFHAIHPHKERTKFPMCSTVPRTYTITKLYMQKELVLLETYITELHKKLYVPSIQKLEFISPYLCIQGTHNCDKELCESFKRREELHDVFCNSGYVELAVSSFARQIQYKYYDRYI